MMLDRYIAVRQAFRYRVLVMMTRIRVSAVFLWRVRVPFFAVGVPWLARPRNPLRVTSTRLEFFYHLFLRRVMVWFEF